MVYSKVLPKKLKKLFPKLRRIQWLRAPKFPLHPRETVTESYEASPTVKASSDENTKSTEYETLGDEESADDPPEIKVMIGNHLKIACIVFRIDYYKICRVSSTRRLRVMLTITLSELVSEVRVTQTKPDETLEVSGEARRLRRISRKPLVLFSIMNVDKYRYVAAESFYKPVIEFSPMPDLHIMWLLHLCEAHQEMQSWAKAAQCVITVAGVVMQEIVDAESLSERERIKMNEALMGLLLRLDSLPKVDPIVRELRRDLSHRIGRLQEILDAVSDTKIQNWDGFLMD
ncbi:BAG family molecular chaperone regulator 5, mitochondrial [Capsicum chinense]|nr:BAG family molecular chaperone regulator 5, mitochondrial [Capsicum chinense]